MNTTGTTPDEAATFTPAPIRRKFESETCSRCHGCGEHSYCQMYGSTCFRCGGAGKTLTKRGSAARAYYNSLCSVRADAVKVGDTLWLAFGLGGRKSCRVVAVGPADTSGWKGFVDGVERAARTDLLAIDTDRGSLVGVEPESMMSRVLLDREERERVMAVALAYEDTLTKAGVPRKRAARPTPAA